MNEYKKYVNKIDNTKILKIFVDDNPESPREWDNLGIMICRHSRYDLGDEQLPKSFDGTFEEFKEYLIKKRDAVVILPLNLYDHSGISISTTSEYPFNCQWDSSRIGYIFATRRVILKEFTVKKISKKLIERVTEILKGEVETYNQYLTGDIYGFNMIELKNCSLGHEHEDIIDSCWGYYGDNFTENGLFESAGIKIEDWDEV